MQMMLDAGDNGSRGIDLRCVEWIEVESADRSIKPKLSTSSGTDVLRMRNWQRTGMDGGMYGPLSYDVPAEEFDPNETITPNGNHRNSVPNALGFIIGVQSLEFGAQGEATIISDFIGFSHFDASIQNRLIGPQCGLIWIGSIGPWSIESQGTIILGYNPAQTSASSSFGFEVIPGSLNRPVIFQPLQFYENETYHQFSPAGQLSTKVSLRITNQVTLQTIWTGLLIENYFATPDPRYALFDLTLREPQATSLFVHHFFCGVETVW